MRSRTTILLCLLTSSAAAQVVIQRAVQSGEDAASVVSGIIEAPLAFSPTMTFFGANALPSDPLGMLQRKQIQEELDLSKDQIEVVKELQRDIQRQTREIFSSGAKFGGDAARMMETAQKAIRENIEKELGEVLSVKQIQRLGQLEVQMSLRNRGVRALTEDKLAKALEISAEQKKDILERQRKAMKDLQEEIEDLKERHRTRLLKELLDDEQLSKLEKMSGNEYQVREINRRRLFSGNE